MNENILIAMNYIDESLVANAVKARNEPKPRVFGKAAAAAAVFVAVAAMAAVLTFINTDKKPLLSLGIEQGDGMGFEGWFFTDISQAENGNPWSAENTPKTLPVYKNLLFDKNGYPCAIDEATQRKRLNDAAKALGLYAEITTVHYASEVYDGCENDFATSVTATTNNGTITSNAAGTVTVFFATSRSLPESCLFDNRENAEKSLRELGTVYAGLSECFFGERKFYCSVSERCNVYGEVTRRYRIYYRKNAEEKILSYNLRYIEFGIDSANRLCSITVNDSLISAKKIADYPIIDESEAKELLLSGNYVTSQIQYEFPGEEYVAKAELVYRCGKGEAIAPYYLFYVELPEAPDEHGLKNYAAYYVPAVEKEYINDFPLYDGEFQ